VTYYLLAALAVIAVATGYHGVTEHHWLLKLARTVRPGTYVPPARHDTRWHGMGHGRRAGVMALLAAAALLAGWAWQSRPDVAVVTLVFTVIVAAVLPAARALARTLGARNPGTARRYRRRED